MSDEWVELVDDAWQLELKELENSGRTHQAFTEEWHTGNKRINHGGFASVRWVLSRRDHDCGTARAAKVMSSRDSSDYYARWAAEVYTHKKVSGHQDIVELLEIYFTSHAPQDKARVVLIQRLCERDDLFKHLMYYYDLSFEDMCAWMQDLLSALAHTHLQEIIHRDIKPSNCGFLFAAGQRKLLQLMDFGSSAILRRKDTSTGTEEVTDPGTGRVLRTRELRQDVTTYRYAAPEVMNREQYNLGG